MTHLLLSPHNDDEGLFASYVCLRHRPKVIVALDGGTDRKHFPDPVDRAAESAAAMRILGCEFEHLGFPVDISAWQPVADRLALEPEPEHVWAPLIEEGGHRHHNRLAELAIALWPGRVSFYATYTVDGKGWPHKSVVGDPVPVQEGWPELKRAALDCYATQIASQGTRMHFERPLDEYVVPGLRLNLGGGLNPIPGFVNLDKSNGWTFEEGLGRFPDNSVEAITESHALMYVDPDLWPFVFAEIDRVLVPGGTLRMTHDAIGAPHSRRPVIRPGAAVATTAELVVEHLEFAGLTGRVVDQDKTAFVDDTLIQQNYGKQPDVFHVEAVKPGDWQYAELENGWTNAVTA